jgi:hypothetical protein
MPKTEKSDSQKPEQIDWPEDRGHVRRAKTLHSNSVGKITSVMVIISGKQWCDDHWQGWKFDIITPTFFLSRRLPNASDQCDTPYWQDRMFIALAHCQ